MATRKQVLAEQVCKAKNDYRILKGMEAIEYSQYDYNELARKSREYELHNELEKWLTMAGNEKEAQEKKARAEAFYATDEGKALKEALEQEWEATQKRFEDGKADYKKFLERFAIREIGEQWAVRNCTDSGCEFAIKIGEKFVFGSEIDVSYSQRWFGEGERFEVNVGTMGCFNPFPQNAGDRPMFYIGFGKLLSNTYALNDLRTRMRAYSISCDNLRSRMQELKDKMDDPVGEQE